MQRSLSPGLQAEGIKPMFQRRGRRSSNVNNGEGLLCVFKASKPPQPCETPKTRRHTPTLRAASPPLRSFDHTEPFMRNDWRTNPLLSLQIYLTERGCAVVGGVSVFHLVLPAHAGRHPLKAALDSCFFHLLVR